MRKQRDYAAEERRRNELARARGFTSRAQQRYRIEKGEIEALQPNRIRSAKTIEAQKFRVGTASQGVERKGTHLPVFGNRVSDRQRAEDWSDIYARSEVAKYNPDERPEGFSKREYTDAYLAAFVNEGTRYVDVRHNGGSDALEYWFVEVMGYMTADEYESRYGQKE